MAEEIAIECEFGDDYYIDAKGVRWALACPWPPIGVDTSIPDCLCIDAERRKRSWDNVKLTNQWTGGTEEAWQAQQRALMDARLEYDRQIEAKKREKEHPGQYWDPAEKVWVKRNLTAAVIRPPVAGSWACPSLGTACCMGACEGGTKCMMQAGEGAVA